MKHIIVLMIISVMTSACSGVKNVINTPKTSIETDTAIATEVPKYDDTSIANNTTILDNAAQISLGKNGIKETSEIIYNEAFDHSLFNNILQDYISIAGNVDYVGIKNNYNSLKNYIDLLKINPPTDSWTTNDKLAYWINAYNALTIDLILKNYPTKSIKAIKDPWNQRLWQFDDKWLNLNDIEHKILRKMNEPRIHFAIVCASISCPKLQNEAYKATQLEQQLSNSTKEFLADTSKNKLSENHIVISKIFKWFKKDFEQNGSLIDFLNRYADSTISEKAKKSYTDYNWDLNE